MQSVLFRCSRASNLAKNIPKVWDLNMMYQTGFPYTKSNRTAFSTIKILHGGDRALPIDSSVKFSPSQSTVSVSGFELKIK